MHLQLRRDNSDTKDRRSIPPASPEVISSLITSLSAIAQPASKHFDDPSLSIPSPISPMDGSFGVEYGAYIHALDRLQEEDDLADLAASPPVIRTSKPPSGFSPITAPKSPRRESSSLGLKSLLRSRPSSKGSASSSHDDTHSIGNLSVERGLPAPPDLRKPSSQESWTTKLSRGHKGLMYMSSRERLRASDSEKKRAGAGGLTSKSSNLSNYSPMNDQILAETTINEEPTIPDLDDNSPNNGPPPDAVHHLRPIPLRESSLRSGRSTRRSSRKSSRQRSEGATAKFIPEDQISSEPKAQQIHRQPSDAETERRHEDILMKGITDPPRDHSTTTQGSRDPNFTYEKAATGQQLEAPGIDDGAPSPAIYQNRRHSSQSADRRKSGRGTPDPTADMIKPKRSSSRLQRLSVGPKSPGSPDNAKDAIMSDPVVGYERPGSADSIDDAVESYLCSTRLSQKIRHPQTGRIISFSEVGDPNGSAVFCCVGMGLTRYITAFYDELGVALKLRLITPDRPGVGDSEAYDGTTTPLSWPDDVYAICQALKVTKFSILAHSAGAIYALATALRMPQHIRGRIHLLAPWIPPSQMNVFGTTQAPPTNAIPTSQKILRALPTPFLKAANSSFMSATSSSITSSLPKNSPRRGKRKSSANHGRDTGASNKQDVVSGVDKENILDSDITASLGDAGPFDRPRATSNDQNPQDAIFAAAADALADKERQTIYDKRLTHAIWDLATTGANPAVDLLVCLERRHTIGFRYVDITRPVVIHHGSRDTRVPVDNVRWLGKAMRRCEVRVLEGESHGLMASANVMGSVLSEISKEWDDWTKLTNPKRTTTTEDRGRSARTTAVR
ncbi:Alpha/Beta hydrolase protein [Xylaria bambusicola]|uniref:Alpha/Beta hydrolase protein n=1 Tax=Xylaria bambusicola TaxID=326684 RepID=UPI002007685E|nr:Alpha/Beta hydrolase protein [Xylaria bambusicola]KAI0505456.1 Alpha/Beta hydrolase protein [Xylaria bambusicola]